MHLRVLVCLGDADPAAVVDSPGAEGDLLGVLTARTTSLELCSCLGRSDRFCYFAKESERKEGSVGEEKVS